MAHQDDHKIQLKTLSDFYACRVSFKLVYKLEREFCIRNIDTHILESLGWRKDFIMKVMAVASVSKIFRTVLFCLALIGNNFDI